MNYLFLAFTLISMPILGGCSKGSAAPKVNSRIEGRWVMPRSWSMQIELNLRPDGTYRQEFFSDVKGFDGITTDKYDFDSKTGILTYGRNTYHRASANGFELLIRDDSWENWKAKKEIYVTLIKISDDPMLEIGHIDDGDPILDLLYSNGVSRN
jgi:hypothetical protein